MSKTPVTIRFEDELWARVRALAGERGQSITVFVSRALEQALAGSSTGEQPPVSGGFSQVGGSTPSRPASARASVPEVEEVIRLQDERNAEMTAEALKREAEASAASLPRIARRHWAS